MALVPNKPPPKKPGPGAIGSTKPDPMKPPPKPVAMPPTKVDKKPPLPPRPVVSTRVPPKKLR